MIVLIVTLYFLRKGVNYGIRRLSEICFGGGIVLMLVVLLLDNTVFLLNLYVQSLGFYFQNLVKLGFHTDAFEQVGHWIFFAKSCCHSLEQLGESYGASDRGRNSGDADGPSDWMQSWTVGQALLALR